MKICFVGPANSSHIRKWCGWFCKRGHEVHVISFTQGAIENVSVHVININVDAKGGDFQKLKYLFSAKQIKRIIDNIQPNIINVHFASSYGVAAALGGVEHYILSVWGSDIYYFPKKSPVHRMLLRYSLKKADLLFSTSLAMAKEAGKYTDREFQITPFGVDMELFDPGKRKNSEENVFTVGTVKSMDAIYGIDLILEAVSLAIKSDDSSNIAVRIAGDGPMLVELKEKARVLGIEDRTTFLGRITQEEAAAEWANMDVAVIPSVDYEAFGVSAVEAQASGTPLIISDVGGLLEATDQGISSIVTPKKDAVSISKAILLLYHDPELRRKMGRAGRKYVQEHFEINECFSRIEDIYFNFERTKV